MASRQDDSASSSRSSSLNRGDELSRRSSTWSSSLDPNNGATSAGQPSLFRILNAAAQYSQLILHEDSSESDSDVVETPASDSAADAQIGLAENDNKQHDAYPSPETALANLALHPHVRPQAGSVTSLQRFAQYATGMTPEIRPKDIRDIKEGINQEGREPIGCDSSKVSDHAVALRILQHEFGELTLPGEVEEMLLETDAALFRDVTILGVIHLTTHRITFHASLLPGTNRDPPGGSTFSHDSHRSADSQILKAGPGVVIEPRTGILHPQKRRRVWIELSHDMITSYPDASDEGRVRPIRSILLSNVKEIDPYDPTQPTRVRMHMSVLGLDVTGDVELDTEESAHEWRRELSAALYMYRHHRKTLIGHGNEKIAPRPEDAQTESRGVRICIPLALIKEYQHEWWAAWACILSVAVEHRTSPAGIRDIVPSGGLDNAVKSVLSAVAPFGSELEQLAQPTMPKSTKRESFTGLFSPATTQAPNLSPVTSISTDSSSARETNNSNHVPTSPSPWLQTSPSSSESEGLAQVLHLSILQGDEKWSQFDNLIKARRENGAPPNAQVVLDWGELVFDEHTGSEHGSEPTREVKVEAPASNEMSSAERKIRRLFAIDDQQKVWIARCRLCKTISSTTYFVITDRFVCYWAKSFGTHDTRYRFPVSSVRGASTAYVYAPLIYGLRLQIRGQHDLTFEFNSRELRDEALAKLKAIADTNLASENGPTTTAGSEVSSPRVERPSPLTVPEFSSTQECVSNAPALFSPLSRTMRRAKSVHIPPALVSRFPKPINLPPSTMVHIPPKHFVCLTIGSRGDVQPYIALARGLMAEGHRVTIVTHEEYKEWCEGWGVAHRTAGGDPGALMKLSVENRMFSPQFFKEGLTNFRDWLDELLLDAWKQCQDADVLIQSPSAMAGAHIAEALKIPFFHAFTMPWTRTNDYPHAFMTPPVEISGSFNYSTYVVFDNVFWQATSGQINRWRRKHLGLPSTDMAHLAQTKIPFIYNFSPAVVPKPLDWKDPITISGYWFLDDADLNWKPTQELTDFMNKARQDNKPLVYIGFGSIVVPNPKAMTRSIVKAVLKSDVRAILSKGWSARMSKETGPEVELPPEVFSVDKIPHDWLFPKVDAALHHGGAGTTGASLRAGIPTLIKPWFGDQFFWATRVMKLGAGLRVSSLSSSDLAEALKRAVSDRVMKEKAAAVGEKIRSENGVANAIRAIYTYLPRA
ncbi:sterol 3beta-glucosyltransferase [Rhizoctonia solani AG-1 IB]|uniref:sterol 3beta-glucosyltransferase n=1 Tax=Thanatephorus cucumeris (strain AG1-IB / isolate 7/3/14) TaxID=1108050 RepID=M5C0F7_THACB|nr:sterol 3beta-glucosyltransferase [Rhizoctonia solani AG-1 IB]